MMPRIEQRRSLKAAAPETRADGWTRRCDVHYVLKATSGCLSRSRRFRAHSSYVSSSHAPRRDGGGVSGREWVAWVRPAGAGTPNAYGVVGCPPRSTDRV